MLVVLEHRVKLLGLARTSVMFGAAGVQVGTAHTAQHSKAHVSNRHRRNTCHSKLQKSQARLPNVVAAPSFVRQHTSLQTKRQRLRSASHLFCSAALMDVPARPAVNLGFLH